MDGIYLRYRLPIVSVLLMFSWHGRAQVIASTMDFEAVPAGRLTSSLQVPGWTVTSDNQGGGNNCTMNKCCGKNPVNSGVVFAPNGLIDPRIGPIYKIYSVYGDSPGLPAANSENPQIIFPMRGHSFFRLSDSALSVVERLTGTFTVTPFQNVLDLAYIHIYQRFHNCCQEAGLQISVTSATCLNMNTSTCGGAYPSGYLRSLTGTTVNGFIQTDVFSKWRTAKVDLSQFMGQAITIMITASYCTVYQHYSYAYIDAQLSPSMIYFNDLPYNTATGTLSFTSCQPAFTLGAQPYFSQYSWQGPGGFSSLSQSIACTTYGAYTLTLLGAAGCGSVKKIIHVLPPAPVVISSNPLCIQNSGTLTATGAVSYTWNNTGTTGATLVVSPTISTTYTVVSLDTAGCFQTTWYPLTVNLMPTVTIKAENSCAGSFMRVKGQGAKIYNWTIGSSLFLYGDSVIFPVPQPTVVAISVFASSAAGCTAVATATAQVHPVPELSIHVIPTATICGSKSYTLTAQGASTYTWTQTSVLGNGPVIASAGAGVFMVLGASDEGCVSSASQSILSHPLPYSTIKGEQSGCAPFCSRFATQRNTVSVVANWESSSEKSSDSSFVFCFPTPGNHTITGYMLDTITGCTNAYSLAVTAYPRPLADFVLNPKFPTENEEVEFLTNGSSDYSFRWFIGDGYNIESTGPRFEYKFGAAGKYAVALVTNNNWGCSDTLVRAVLVAEDFLIYVPNSFSPDQDELNEVFLPVARGVKDYQLFVFDRWGHILFSSFDITGGWDGTYNGQPCKSDVYTWIIHLSSISGFRKSYSGSVFLRR